MGLLPKVKSHYGQLKLLINGEWVTSASTQFEVTTNPATEEEIAEYPQATKAEARAAVESAQQGFVALNKIALQERARMLFDMRHTYDTHDRCHPRRLYPWLHPIS